MATANYKERACTKCNGMYKPSSPTQEWCNNCLTKTCLQCGAGFRMKSKAHEGRAKFCSPECRRENWKLTMVGENAPNLKNGQRIKSVPKKCAMCGNEYLVSPTHSDVSKFCCRKCFDNYRSKYMRGANSTNWKGGIAIPRNTVMIRREYKEWRAQVFSRDGYACTMCGDATGGNLRAHHIKEYASHPELRLDVDNGTTLCDSCHKAVHKYKLDIQSELPI